MTDDLVKLVQARDLEGARREARKLQQLAGTLSRRSRLESLQRIRALLGRLDRELSTADVGARAQLESLLLPIVATLSRSTGARLPNVLFGGFGKCGSTTLFHHLQGAETVTTSLLKEPRYFQVFPGFSSALYARLFEDSQAPIVLDGTPGYSMCSDRGLSKMPQVLAGNVKLIFITRDPAQRAVSAYFSPGRTKEREDAGRGKGRELPKCELSLRRELDELRELVPEYRGGRISFDELRSRVSTRHVLGGMFNLMGARVTSALPGAASIHLRLEDDLSAAHLERTRARLSGFLDVELPPWEVTQLNRSRKRDVNPDLLDELRAFYAEFDGQSPT